VTKRILFALLATASIPAILGPQPAAAAIAAPAKLTQMGHISIEAIGKGPPVILIPGLASPRAVWDGVAPELAKTHTVYLVQVNGFAGDDPRDNLTPGLLDGVVAELHAYIVDHKLKGAPVVGHSMGGLVTLMLAHAHPDDAGRTMIVDSLPYIGSLFMPDAKVEAIEPTAAGMRDKMAANYGKPADVAAATATANQLALKPESRVKVTAWAEASDPRVTALAFYEDMTTDLRPDMGGIATPITLVYPAGPRGDALYHAEYAKAPHMTYVPVADSAHFVMLDQPEAFRTALVAFLAQ
jgi:pimeloyl-ACP methyl ester carboxylesterase